MHFLFISRLEKLGVKRYVVRLESVIPCQFSLLKKVEAFVTCGRANRESNTR